MFRQRPYPDHPLLEITNRREPHRTTEVQYRPNQSPSHDPLSAIKILSTCSLHLPQILNSHHLTCQCTIRLKPRERASNRFPSREEPAICQTLSQSHHRRSLEEMISLCGPDLRDKNLYASWKASLENQPHRSKHRINHLWENRQPPRERTEAV